MRTRPRKDSFILKAEWFPEPMEMSEQESVQARIISDTTKAYLRFECGLATVADLQHLRKYGYADKITQEHFRRALAMESLETNQHLDRLG